MEEPTVDPFVEPSVVDVVFMEAIDPFDAPVYGLPLASVIDIPPEKKNIDKFSIERYRGKTNYVQEKEKKIKTVEIRRFCSSFSENFFYLFSWICTFFNS